MDDEVGADLGAVDAVLGGDPRVGHEGHARPVAEQIHEQLFDATAAAGPVAVVPAIVGLGGRWCEQQAALVGVEPDWPVLADGGLVEGCGGQERSVGDQEVDPAVAGGLVSHACPRPSDGGT